MELIYFLIPCLPVGLGRVLGGTVGCCWGGAAADRLTGHGFGRLVGRVLGHGPGHLLGGAPVVGHALRLVLSLY